MKRAKVVSVQLTQGVRQKKDKVYLSRVKYTFGVNRDQLRNKSTLLIAFMARKSPVTTHGEIHNRIVTEKSFSIFAAILTRTNK